MKILMIMMTLMLTVGACDRTKGKGSDIQWQQRHEEHKDEDDIRAQHQREQLQRKYERQHNYFGPK